MADGMTVTGLDLRAVAMTLPDRLLSASRRVAQATAVRIQAGARARLLEQLKTDRHALADAITVIEDAANKQIVVSSVAPRGQPANLPLWNEYGTSTMPARRYMRPAAQAENAQYAADIDQAIAATLQETLG